MYTSDLLSFGKIICSISEGIYNLYVDVFVHINIEDMYMKELN